MYLPYVNQPDDTATQHAQSWTDNISQPLLDFLSNLNDRQICSEVQEEMLIELSTPENDRGVIEMAVNDDATYLDYLSNTQQDDLLRKFILQGRTLVPEVRCSECSNRSCKIMQSYK